MPLTVRASERSEGWIRSLGAPLEMRQNLFDHRWNFNSRDHLHRAATVFTRFDLDFEHVLQPAALQLVFELAHHMRRQ